MRPLWYRNAVIYQIDPSLFRDSNGDGCGDLRGITERLDYIRGLGCTAIWLMPFYQSPFEDAGYDISDHLQVAERFGDLADIVALLEKAEELGLHVIIELVQHTSSEHRWFQEARRDRDSPYRDYYIWADEPDDAIEPIFPTVEDSVWTWDEQAGQYYRHLFYKHEPDLNPTNPRVIHEIERIMSFWLRLGVSGFRIDAAVHMVRQAGGGDLRQGYWLLEHMRDFVTMRRPETVLLGEIDTDPEKYIEYFGDEADRVTLLLDFWVNNHLFLALARQQAEPLCRALNSQPLPPSHSQYALWIRNHDELSLDRLEEDERNEVLDTFAPTRTCAPTTAVFADAWRPCSTATSDASPPPTPCSSPCPARRSSATARKSAWATISSARNAWRCARRCSGPTSPTPASPASTRNG